MKVLDKIQLIFIFVSCIIALSRFAYSEIINDSPSGEEELLPEESQVQNAESSDIGEIQVIDNSIRLRSVVTEGETIFTLERKDFPPSAVSVADVLEKIPGVLVMRTGSEGSLTGLSLRGASSNQILIMLNGAPLSLPGGTSIDLSLLELAVVEKIEVATGLSYGSRAMGGIINVITRDKLFKELKPRKKFASFSMGSFSTRKAGFALENPANSNALLLFANAFSTAGDFPYRSKSGEGRVRLNNETNRASLLLNRQSWDDDSIDTINIYAGMLFRGVPGFSEFPTLEANLTEALFNLSYENFNSGRSGETRANRQWDKEFRFSASGSLIRFIDPKPVLGGEIREFNKQVDISSEFNLISNFSERVSLNFLLSKMLASDFGSPSRFSTRLTLSKAWKKAYGEISPTVNINSAQSLPTTLSGGITFSTDVSPRANIHLVVGRSFRYPDFSELYYPSKGFIRGNKDLRSERANFIEAGIELDIVDFNLSLVGFQRDQKNTIKFVPISAYAIAPVNTGKVNAKGVMLSFTAKPSNRFQIDSTYTYTSSSYGRSKLELTQTPKYKFFASVGYEFRGGTLGLSQIRESSQSADLFGSIRVPRKSITNLETNIKMGKGNLHVSVQNIFNNSARDFWDLPLPGRFFEVAYESLF